MTDKYGILFEERNYFLKPHFPFVISSIFFYRHFRKKDFIRLSKVRLKIIFPALCTWNQIFHCYFFLLERFDKLFSRVEKIASMYHENLFFRFHRKLLTNHSFDLRNDAVEADRCLHDELGGTEFFCLIDFLFLTKI